MKKNFLNCLYCNDNIKAHLLSETRNYYYCKKCTCQYIQKNEAIIKIELDTKYNNKFYTVQLDLIKNETHLISGSIIYSYNECLAISPQNINKKIRVWLLMQ